MGLDWIYGGPSPLSKIDPLKDLGNAIWDWYKQPVHSKSDYNFKQLQRSLPFVGNIFQAEDNTSRMEDYLRNRGLNYSNVRYNSAPFGSSYGGALQSSGVSVANLYKSMNEKSKRDKERRKRDARNDQYRREILHHRQVQSAWYRNHMRYR